jgi:hypothetical protein
MSNPAGERKFAEVSEAVPLDVLAEIVLSDQPEEQAENRCTSGRSANALTAGAR